MTEFKLESITEPFCWLNEPLAWNATTGSLWISAAGKTDLFIDPNGDSIITNSPVALFTPRDGDFTLSAKASVTLNSRFDAAVIVVYGKEDVWAKLCLEYSPQRQPTVVTVVTRTTSDDANGAVLEHPEVYLRTSKKDSAFAFHYSFDAHFWQLVRYFSLGELQNPRIGFSAQSPMGGGCEASFSEVVYKNNSVKDFRNGE